MSISSLRLFRGVFSSLAVLIAPFVSTSVWSVGCDIDESPVDTNIRQTSAEQFRIPFYLLNEKQAGEAVSILGGRDFIELQPWHNTIIESIRTRGRVGELGILIRICFGSEKAPAEIFFDGANLLVTNATQGYKADFSPKYGYGVVFLKKVPVRAYQRTYYAMLGDPVAAPANK